MKKSAVFFLFIAIALQTYSNSIIQDRKDESCKILFLGSSYFGYNDLPQLFKNLAESANKNVTIDSYNPGGMYLSDHAVSITSENYIDKHKWDYVVLQGVGRNTAYPTYFTDHPVLPALLELEKKIKANSESTKIVFCMPWAFEDGMTWYGWPDNYEVMQKYIYQNTINFLTFIDLIIAPVGWAWYRVLEDKNYPLHYLHSNDWNHPSINGSYIMACVIFSTLFKENSTLSIYNSTLTSEDAAYFKEVSSEIVLNDLELWNIDTETTAILEINENSEFRLYQNMPNPFSGTTTINYNLSNSSFVNISVYNLLGEKVMELVNQKQSSGNYSVSFNAYSLQNGIYCYKMSCDNFTISKRMILYR